MKCLERLLWCGFHVWVIKFIVKNYVGMILIDCYNYSFNEPYTVFDSAQDAHTETMKLCSL